MIQMKVENVMVAETLSTSRKVILKLTGFTCIHDRPPDDHFRYCTGCPFDTISNDECQFTTDQSRVICTERRSYGK